MGFSDTNFNNNRCIGFRRFGDKKNLKPKISEKVSVAISDVNADFIEVFHSNKNVSEIVSSAITNITISFTSV